MNSISSNNQPGLFGLSKSNKNFSHRDSWGKNTFNNAFPVALSCYMHSKGLQPVYLMLNDQGGLNRSKISVDELFGVQPLSSNAFLGQ